MQILKYTEAIQKVLGCKTKPEPWLHIAVQYEGFDRFRYAIYIWDTRKVLEARYNSADSKAFNAVKKTSAIDNHKPLNGKLFGYEPEDTQFQMRLQRQPVKQLSEDNMLKLAKKMLAGYEVSIRDSRIYASKTVKAYDNGYTYGGSWMKRGDSTDIQYSNDALRSKAQQLVILAEQVGSACGADYCSITEHGD